MPESEITPEPEDKTADPEEIEVVAHGEDHLSCPLDATGGNSIQ
jgi:hypothetical protein